MVTIHSIVLILLLSWVTLSNTLCRKEAFKQAVSSAKSKAQCISQTIGVQLGAALEVTEISQEEIHNPFSRLGSEVDPNVPQEVGASSRLHQLLNTQELAYSSQVAVIFEAHPLRSCSHKKCHKH